MNGRAFRILLFGAGVLAGCTALTGASDLHVGGGETDLDGGGANEPSTDSATLSGEHDVDAGRGPNQPSDDGGTNEASAPDAPSGPKRVFTSSATYNGDLGGFAGADAKCNQLAQAAGLSGTFMAWLSTSSTFAKDRVTGTGPWSLVGQDDVAVTEAQLTNPPVTKAIRRNELGQSVGGLVWTGTDTNGTFLDDDCDSWTSAAGFKHAATGASFASNGEWTASTPADCDELHRLYCFEL